MTHYKRKINEQGEYLPFYGYTSVSMLETADQPETNIVESSLLETSPASASQKEKTTSFSLKSIEDFIRESSIGKYYSPLPHETYHMTLFNIYAMASKPIPSVERWVTNEDETIPETVWLPEEVLNIQHIRASDALRKLPRKLKIKDLKFYYKKGGIGVWVTLDKEHEKYVTNLRKDFAEIYEHGDENLKLHITFAYLYKQLPFGNDKDGKDDKDDKDGKQKGETSEKKAERNALKKDIVKLIEMLNPLKQCVLTDHNIYLYNSMTNYFPLDFFFSSNVPM